MVCSIANYIQVWPPASLFNTFNPQNKDWIMSHEITEWAPLIPTPGCSGELLPVEGGKRTRLWLEIDDGPPVAVQLNNTPVDVDPETLEALKVMVKCAQTQQKRGG